MHRIDTTNAVANLFGAGKDGFGPGNPGTNTPATFLDNDFCNALQEELAAIPEAAGIALNKGQRNQVLTAILALFESLSIGRGQAWTNVTSTRALGVTYYNTTGRPIMLSVYCSASSGGSLNMQINGTTLNLLAYGYPAASAATFQLIVPAGASYMVFIGSGTMGLNSWLELR